MKLEEHYYDSEGTRCHGFIVYNADGRSLPKGFISSFNAHSYSVSGTEKVWIEFGIQSPTGDASDHHHFSFPCESFSQAVGIMEMNKACCQARVMAQMVIGASV